MVDFAKLSARVKAQEEAKKAARKSNYRCSLIESVGTGKSKIMIDLAEELIRAGKVKSILYTCDNRRLKNDAEDGFPKELQKWASAQMIKITRRECYQTCYKWEGEQYDLLLGDEVDMAITPEYVKTFLNNTFKYMILVSGTLSGPKRNVLHKIAPIVHEMRSFEAEVKCVVNKTEYYTYNYKLTPVEEKEYNTLTGKIRQLAKIGTHEDDATYQFWIRKRKHFLNTLESSAKHCRKVVQFLEQKDAKNRIVIFCERREQADKVCEYSFHGENEKDDMLTSFQEGEINKISVVAKVKRGINLKKVNVGIHESLSGSSTEWEQRAGRLKRLEVGQMAIIVFLVPWYQKKDKKTNQISYKATVVQDWVKRATSNIPNIKFNILKLS
jgi:superfamily II DNA or RNA helicase